MNTCVVCMTAGFLLSSIVMANSLAEAPLETNQLRAFVLASSCIGCHGPDGASATAIPSLQGKPKNFIVQALTDYKTHKRKATIMHKLAKGYTDEEIQLIAAWFSNRQGKQTNP